MVVLGYIKVEKQIDLIRRRECLQLLIENMKALNFIGSSLDDLRNFPDEARRAAGFELFSVQCGLEPSDWKPMHSIGSGTKEIRIHILGEWRVIYVAKFANAVYVLHSFHKKSRKTSRRDIEVARQRYKFMEAAL